MPPLPSVVKVIRVDLLFSHGANARIRDRLFFAYSGAGPTNADLITLANTIAAAWGTNMSQDQVAAVALIGINITDLNSSTGGQVFTTQSRVGTNIGTAGNAGFSIIVKFKIARRYRGGHPRFYMPGPPNTQLTTSTTFATAFASGVATHFASFITAAELAPPVSIGALSHINVSYFAGFTNRTFPSGRTRPVPTLRVTPLQDAVSSYSTNPIVAQQRRRNQQSP